MSAGRHGQPLPPATLAPESLMLAYVIRRLLTSDRRPVLATIFVFVLVASPGTPWRCSRPTPTSPSPPSWRGRSCSTSTTRCGSATGSGSPAPSTGNLGTTITGQDVASDAMSHLFVTLRMVHHRHLSLSSWAVSMGVVAAVRQGKVTDHATTVTNFVFLATPVFVLGLALKEFVAIPINQHLNPILFYTDGEQSPTLSGSFLQRLPDYAAHTALPAITLILATYSVVGDLPAVVDDRDPRRRPRAAGAVPRALTQRRVLFRHVLRNALIPITTVVALDFAAVLGGAIITEIVFGWQGIGVVVSSTASSPSTRTSCWPTCSSRRSFVILFNLLADILYGVLDPRIRYD